MAGAWDLFVGIIGVLTGIPIAWTLIAMQLPSRKLRDLFDALSETETLLESCVEGGLLREHHVLVFQGRLTALRNRAIETRTQAYARNIHEEFANWMGGLSSKINRISKDVRDVGSRIKTTSSHEREERQRTEATRRTSSNDSLVVSQEPNIPHQRSVWEHFKFMLRRVISQLSYAPEGTIPHNEIENPPTSLPSIQPQMGRNSLAPSVARSAARHQCEPSLGREDSISGVPSASCPTRGRSVACFPLPHSKRKGTGSPYSRARAMFRFMRRSRRRSLLVQPSDAIAISFQDLSAIELLQADDDEWEDIMVRGVQVVL
ncbi:hypothetical protein C8Q78DRAFT_1040155 [Trametes maxima]|nr:hypothetical protein C8Q78DRAFT_1040155 [Trametes maxima]